MIVEIHTNTNFLVSLFHLFDHHTAASRNPRKYSDKKETFCLHLIIPIVAISKSIMAFAQSRCQVNH